MGAITTTMETIENLPEIEGDPEIEEVVRDTEAGNLHTQENPHIQDRDLTADTVETSQGPQMTTDKNLIDQRMVEMRGEVEAKDTSPKKTGEVSMAMGAGAEKSTRRP